MESQEDRLEKRLNEIRSCKTPEELSFVIWSKGMDEAIGSRQSYRDGFVDWINCTAIGEKPKWKYATIFKLVESIWPPYLDEENDEWFKYLRIETFRWISNYTQIPYQLSFTGFS